jgi:predicted O-methyltransferase YrrM
MIDYRHHAAMYETHQMSMDRRHAVAIGKFLRQCKGIDGIVEVGCCYGVSTAEVLAAADEIDAHVVLIDPVHQPSLKAMVAEAPPKRVSLCKGTSVELLAKYLTAESIAILDGDHSLAAADFEAEICAAVMPRAIILHDVTNRAPGCEGPGWFMHVFQRVMYRPAIDCLPRHGERTGRGLAILCRDATDHLEALFACTNA